MKKIKTIADLKIDLTIEKQSFKEFEKLLCEQVCEDIKDAKFKKSNWNKYSNSDLIQNFERKIINGTYEIKVPIMTGTPLLCFTESVEVISKNMTLGKFMYKICQTISELLEKYDDWHIFLEGFRKIDEKTYEVYLGS